MRLYLSSFRLGERTDLLVDLVRRSAPPSYVAVVANAIDDAGPVRRAEGVTAELERLAGLGLEARELDLREHADAPDTRALETELSGCSALWVRGGNVFVLRAALARSGADVVLPRLIAADALVYAGYSAGPCVLAPSLRGLETIDDVAAVSRVSADDALAWDGLGVLDRPFVPHLASPGHPETERAAALASSYRRRDIDFWGLRDGQVLVVDGELTSARVV